MRFKLTPSAFIKNIAILASGASISHAVRFLLTPIVTRLFLPEHFGITALFLSISTVIASGACLRYEQALIIPDKERDAVGLFIVGLVVLLSFCLISYCVFTGLFWFAQFAWIDSLGLWLFIIPIVILLSGISGLLSCWNLRKKQFKVISGAVVGNSVTIPATRIGLGAFWGSEVAWLNTGILLGLTAKVLLLLRGFKFSFEKTKIKFDEMVRLAIQYKDFPLYSAPTVLIRSFTANLPVLMLSFIFPSSIVGFYALTNRVLRLPLDVLLESIRQVFFQRGVELRNNGRELMPLLSKTTAILALIGLPPFFVLYYFGEILVTYFLGAEWSTSGRYLKILIPVFYTTFITSPSMVIFVLLRKQSFWLQIQICLALSVIAVFSICYFLAQTPEKILFSYAVVNVLFILSTLITGFILTARADKRLIPSQDNGVIES